MSKKNKEKRTGSLGIATAVAGAAGGMTIDRRQFTKVAGAGAAAMAVAWQQACVQVSDTGKVSAETVRTLLDAQGPRGIYDDEEEFERLRRAIANSTRIANELRAFPLSEDEQPLTIFRRG